MSDAYWLDIKNKERMETIESSDELHYIYKVYSEYEPGEPKLVAKIYEDVNGELLVKEMVDMDYNYFPPVLLGIFRDWERDDTPTIRRWLETRVVPKTRQFLREMLDAEGLPEWNLVDLLKLNQGRYCDDKFFIEVEIRHTELEKEILSL